MKISHSQGWGVRASLGLVRILPLTTLLLGANATLGQSPPTVRVAADLVHIPVDEDAFPKEFRVADHQTFFLATDSVHGQELWRSDGTAAGTRLVTDLLPGALNSQVRPLDVDGDRLYFGLDGQLWITDGTDAGTSFIVNPGPLDSPYEIISGVTLGSRLLFVAAHEELGRALWVSDGTAEGTVSLPLSFGTISTPTDWIQVGDRAFFSTVDQFGRAGLWISDGTPEGTEVLAETCFACFVSPSHLTPLGDLLVFVADSGSFGSEPWVSDGTPAGTRRLADFRPGSLGSFPTSLGVLGDTAYGILRAGCSGADCIFSSQGTAESTRLAGHLYPPAAVGRPVQLRVVDTTLYLRIEGPQDTLWALDGAGGAELIAESSFIELLGDAHGTLIFQIRDPELNLLATAGTPQSTRSLATDLSVYQLAEVGEQTLLAAQPFVDGLLRDSELWITDGTEMSATPLPEIRPPTSSSDPSQLVAWGDDLAWMGFKDDRDHRALWLLENGPSNSQAPIALATGFSPTSLVTDGDRLYAGTYPGFLVLKRDGSSHLIDTADTASEIVPFKDGLLISANTLSLGQNLWLSDGTQDGTDLLIDVNPTWSSTCPVFCPSPNRDPFPNQITALEERALFVAFENEDGPAQLWSTDGTTLGTQVIREFEMDADHQASLDSPRDLIRVGDWVYFTAFDRLTGREVWRTDGTTEGTRLVADVTPDGDTAEPSLLTAWNPSGGPAAAVWVLRDQNGDKLLRSYADVPPRAELIIDFGDPEIGGPGAQIHELVASGDLLYLAVTTPTAGRELWVSDGFRQGTRLLDLRTDNPRGSGVAELTAIPNGVYFAAAGGPGGAGFEPWISRGTEADTFMVADLFPGPSGSDPGPGTWVRTALGDRLYFAADNGEIGRELFVIELSSSTETCPTDRLCLQQGRFEITMDWHTASGASGTAQRVSSTEDSGLLWFFEADNWEAMVKVLDGCDLNDHFWVFAATSTDVGYTLTVEDLLTGEQKSYSNPPGENAAAITDTAALATCP